MKYDIWLHSTTLSFICMAILATISIGILIIDDQIYDEDLFYLILQSTITLFSIIIALSIISIEHSASNHTSTILKLYMYDNIAKYFIRYKYINNNWILSLFLLYTSNCMELIVNLFK